MIYPHHGRWPQIHETAFVAPSADVLGEVEVGAHSSVWFQVVVRGDVNSIKIGARTNIQDHSMLHVTRAKQRDDAGKGAPLIVGDDVTVGHRVTLHGCTVGNRCLIGMGAIIMDHAVVGDDCIVGAGALITQGVVIPPRSLVMGAPAKVVRALREDEISFLPRSAANYVKDASEYQGALRGAKRHGAGDADLSNFGEEDELAGELGDDLERPGRGNGRGKGPKS